MHVQLLILVPLSYYNTSMKSGCIDDRTEPVLVIKMNKSNPATLRHFPTIHIVMHVLILVPLFYYYTSMKAEWMYC